MNLIDSKFLGPDVIERVRGGYLAVIKRSVAIRLGAVGATEDQAVAAFNEVAQSWLRARDAEKAAVEIC